MPLMAVSTGSPVGLVAGYLEVQSSKCSMSYRRRLKRDLLGHEGAWWWLVGLREKNGNYCGGVLAACSTSMWSSYLDLRVCPALPMAKLTCLSQGAEILLEIMAQGELLGQDARSSYALAKGSRSIL
jgi:hypothetical protein